MAGAHACACVCVHACVCVRAPALACPHDSQHIRMFGIVDCVCLGPVYIYVRVVWAVQSVCVYVCVCVFTWYAQKKNLR